MRRLFVFVLFLFFIFSFSSCNITFSYEKISDDEKLSRKFIQHCPHDRLKRCNLPSGGDAALSVKQDNDDYYTIIDVQPALEEDDYIFVSKSSPYKWAALPLSEIKSDMKFIADKFADFAIEQELSAPYYLYIVCSYPSFVYDYESDTLFYSDKLDALVEMYYRYGTMIVNPFNPNEDARQFAKENGIADAVAFGVYINNGEFSNYGLENALIY